MDKYYKNIEHLIENNLVEVKKNEMVSNSHTLITYYNIGQQLVEAQGGETRAKYGSALVKEYSIKLAEKYGTKYKRTNLMLMRQLYLSFPKVHALRGQLNWTILKLLLPIKNEFKRNYYINITIEHNLSSRELMEYIKSNAYERLVNKNVELKYLEAKANNYNILDMIKNPILISIDKNVDRITERALKKYMIHQIEKTMLELGQGFAFVGSEKPIKLNNKIHRPDLIFFNIELNCYVIFELKLKELKKTDIGQIEFYIKFYDSEIKKDFHNSTIGITISKRIDDNLIKYNTKDNIKHTTYEVIDN